MRTHTFGAGDAAQKHGIFKKLRANVCKHCPLCKIARTSPESLPGKILHHPVHSKNCPAWKAYNEIYGDQKIL